MLKVALVKLLVFSTHEMKYFWYLPIKSKFSFYFALRGKNFFASHFSLILLGSALLVGTVMGTNSLHLENGSVILMNE